ncbi:hypothetical protein AHMF7605_08535 [Adhaeribacter arboris]|uniref:Lipocalin-like domain-containing protein n=1 Tax=Adhaeribacter arboris TaxID=2072846 RepID=A0A2T2YDI1_9BACT|nr:hypothetical protein [Adhaeribacter arboris]PSR53570.1 hypothetical protein AHMF7605_08535 [Adhaeribacter arboris]
MKILFFIPLLCWIVDVGPKVKPETNTPLNSSIKGKWTNERTHLQFIVDSHLVHEEEITDEKGKEYNFDGTTVQVIYPDGTTAQGTYSVFIEEEKKKLFMQLRGTTNTYTLIAVTPTSMAWQKDLEDTYYYEGFTRKSAERAIYTEELKRKQ